jgi:hypothetical protein
LPSNGLRRKPLKINSSPPDRYAITYGSVTNNITIAPITNGNIEILLVTMRIFYPMLFQKIHCDFNPLAILSNRLYNQSNDPDPKENHEPIQRFI